MEESDNSYKELCSSETVCSAKKGFFHDFNKSGIEDIGKTVITKIFSKLSEDDDRIRCIFTEPKINNVVLETLNRVKCLYRDKDALISRAKRREGFHLASCKDNERALLCFSQAVLRAPNEDSSDKFDKGLDLSLALLGRAEVLMDLGEYEFALDDLESINHNLPADEIKNQKKCLEKCHHFISESQKTLELCKISDEDRQVKFQNNYRELPLPHLTGGIHTSMPGLSKLVVINDTPTAGKHAVAADNIRIGDTVACESPLASCLLPEYYGTHCHHCFVRLRAPVGCPRCSNVAFCRRKCRDEAEAIYHKYECKILALLIGSGMSILSMLSLRMVTQIGLKACVELHNNLKQPNQSIETMTNVEKKSSKSSRRRLRKKKLKEGLYQIDKRAYDLVTLSEKRTPIDFFERSLMAAFLLKCLKLVDFFDTPSLAADALTEEEIAVGSILLRNLQLLQFNAHEIFETQLGNDHRFRGSKTVYLGIAIYPSASRFNHDCYPAVTRYFAGKNIILRATRPLKPGEVVAENYGPIFTKRNLKVRRRCLEGRYWFRCTCRACTEDWPNFDDLINKQPRIKCTTEGCNGMLIPPRTTECLTKCSSCKKKVNLNQSMADLKNCEEDYSRGFAAMDDKKPSEAMEIFINALENFHKIASPPHRPTHLAEIALASCMASSGNVWKSLNIN